MLGKENEKILKKVFEKIHKVAQHDGVSVHKLYKSLDIDKDGRLSSGDFFKSFKMMKLQMSKEESDLLVLSLDSKGSGFVMFEDFEKAYGSTFANQQREQVLERPAVTEQMREFAKEVF